MTSRRAAAMSNASCRSERLERTSGNVEDGGCKVGVGFCERMFCGDNKYESEIFVCERMLLTGRSKDERTLETDLVR